MTTATLLSRHAEGAFWLARYLERAESMARILEAQAAFQRGRPDEDSWSWIVALYSDQKSFYEKFQEANAQNLIAHYVTSLENHSSIQSSVRAARENARALRPLISTDMWLQINDFYTRLLALTEADFSETRLTRSCDTIKRGCYAEIGVAESTLYRDESWPFFRLGLFIERADQTSRLLDVQFARRATGIMKDAKPEQQEGLWNALLRSASAYHSYRRGHHSGFEPGDVIRFLIFDTRLPRSISFCANEIQRMVGQLRGEFHLRNAQRSFERVERFQSDLQAAAKNGSLLDGLHGFNEWVQSELMALTLELSSAFFGRQPEPASPEKDPAVGPSGRTMSQSQSSGSSQTQTQG